MRTTRPPRARKGPNGSVDLRAARPPRTSVASATGNTLMNATVMAPITPAPRPAPSSTTSLTSPIPINEGLMRLGIRKKMPATIAASMNSKDRSGEIAICATRTIAVAGNTIRFGMIRRSRSVAASTTSTAAMNAAITAPPPSGWLANASPANIGASTRDRHGVTEERGRLGAVNRFRAMGRRLMTAAPVLALSI